VQNFIASDVKCTPASHTSIYVFRKKATVREITRTSIKVYDLPSELVGARSQTNLILNMMLE